MPNTRAVRRKTDGTSVKSRPGVQGATSNTQRIELPLHRTAISRTGEKRIPVILKRDGSFERVKLTPGFGGLLAVVEDQPILFGTGKWAGDAGWPKLRWISL